jgi:hypothetical protein
MGDNDALLELDPVFGALYSDRSEEVSFLTVSAVFLGIPVFLGIESGDVFGFVSFFLLSAIFRSFCFIRSSDFLNLPRSLFVIVSAA